MLKLSDFNFNLPKDLIAQYPASKREMSKLLIVDKASQELRHHNFKDIMQFLSKGDCLVLNDTKVLSARLWGKRLSGGKVEILLLNPLGEHAFEALFKPAGRLKDGEKIFLEDDCFCYIIDAKKKIVGFNGCSPEDVMRRAGQLPLPPYIRRMPQAIDIERYQTVFAKKDGAVAAPTAGLHFTKKLLNSIKKKGVRVVYLTLHVNYATFSPIRCEDVSLHKMRPEYFEIPQETFKAISQTKKEGRKVFAVGTTVCKALEDAYLNGFGKIEKYPMKKSSTLFIYPPFSFKVVDGLITNFHLPGTSLLLLVSAFAGRDCILNAYRQAVDKNYRFYSYGDAMLIA